MLLGSMAAYVLARYTFSGNRVVYCMFVAGLAFPVFLALVPLFFVVKQRSGCSTRYTGLILVYIAYSLPFTVFFLPRSSRRCRPRSPRRRSIDGASHTRLFFQVMMPMAKPGLISITIFNIIGQWNQSPAPVVLMQGEDDTSGC